MADDCSRGAKPSKNEREAEESAAQKHLGENGLPQKPPTPKQQDAANRTKMTVSAKPDPSPHEIKQAVSEE